MKTKVISKILLTVGLVFVLGSAVTQVRSEDDNVPVMTIQRSKGIGGFLEHLLCHGNRVA